MKINYFDPKPLPQQDKNFMLMLQADEDFEELVKIVRKKANLPAEGILPTKPDEGHTVFPKETTTILDQINENHLHYGIKFILNSYNLPLTWFFTIYTIVIFNIFIRPDRDYHKKTEIIYRSKLDLIPSLPDYGREPHPTDLEPHMVIVIKEGGISFREFQKELENHREAIERYLSYLPHDPKTKFEATEVKNRILELHRQVKPDGKSLTSNEIADIIYEEFRKGIDYNFDLDQTTINAYIKRYKERLEELNPKSKFSSTLYRKLLEEVNLPPDEQAPTPKE